MHTLPIVNLKPGREIPVKAGHPWIFSNAIAQCSHDIPPGALVCIVSARKEQLGIGIYNPTTSIRIRLLTHQPDIRMNTDFFIQRFNTLAQEKQSFLPADTNAYRLVHSDADLLPGVIVDLYDNTAVIELSSKGMDLLRPLILDALRHCVRPSAIVERSDTEARRLEGLEAFPTTTHHGSLQGPLEFKESGIRFLADVVNGQKTGFYLDQRNTRIKIASLAHDKTILNLFGYTGAFALYALKGHAREVTTIDSSENALALGRQICRLNGYADDPKRIQFMKDDVFDFLNASTTAKKHYDLIICDPPAFTKSLNKKEGALKAYTMLNRLCLGLLDHGGILCTSSCSGRVSLEEFQNALRLAAGLAGRDVRILDILGQPCDHTSKFSFPEGRYLKTIIGQVMKTGKNTIVGK